MSGKFRGSFSVDQGSFADRGSVAGLDTIGSSLSGSLKRRGTRAGQPSSGNDHEELSLRAFVRPKRGSDGGPRHDELVLLHYHPADDMHHWLEDVTTLLRQPLRGTNTFPQRACLNPTGFAVALYAVMQATYPATLVKMRSLEDALKHCARLGPTACFLLHTIEQHSTGLQEAASAELRAAMAAARAKKAHIDAIFKPGYDALPPEDGPAEEDKAPQAAEATRFSDPKTKLPAVGSRAAGGSKAGGSSNKRLSKRASSKASGGQGSRNGSRNGSRRESRNGSRAGSRRGSAAGSVEGEGEDDEDDEGSGSTSANPPADFAMVLRHNLHKCAVCIEACCRKEAPPRLLAEWLLGSVPGTKDGENTDGSGVGVNNSSNDDDDDNSDMEGTTPPVLTPALWKCFVVLCRDRVLADPRGALGPVSALLGAVGSLVQAATSVAVVKDVPSSKPQAIGAEDSLNARSAPRRADPRGLVVHFMEQATLTTIDESDDTTFYGAPQGHAANSSSVDGGGDDASSLGSTSSSGSKSRVSSISSLGAGGSFVRDRAKNANANNSSSSYEEDSPNSPRVRYMPFNDRSEDPIVPFYCHCLACEPDPDLDIEPTYEQNDRVYGLGAVRYWWQADYHPSLGAGDAYLVGNQSTERGLVRRVALGEPIAKVLAPTPGSLRRVAAATEARRERWRRKKGLAPRFDAASSSSSADASGAAAAAAASSSEKGEDGSTPLEDPAAKLERLVFELKVCGDPACAVRAAELEAEGVTVGNGSDVHSHGGGSGGLGGSGPVRAKKGDTAQAKGLSGRGHGPVLGSIDQGRDAWEHGGGAWAAKRTDNPVLAMLEGFGAHLEFEGDEFDGLQKVMLPPHDTPGVRTALLDTFVANGVVARVWLAHGPGLNFLEEKFGGRGGGGDGPSAATSSPAKGAAAGGAGAPRSRRSSINSSTGSQGSTSRRGSKTPSAKGDSAGAAAGAILPPIDGAIPEDKEAPDANEDDEEELFEIEEPRQHMVSWESLTKAQTRSPWHGPFTSDGAARRHAAQFLDFSHLLFELCLRQPFAQELQSRREETHRSATTTSSDQVDNHDQNHRDEMAGAVRWRGTGGSDHDCPSSSGSSNHGSRRHSAAIKNNRNKLEGAPLALVQRLALRDAALRRQDPVLFARNPDWDRARIPATAGALARAAVSGRNTTRKGKSLQQQQQQHPSGSVARPDGSAHNDQRIRSYLPPIGGTLNGVAPDGISLGGSLEGSASEEDSRSHGQIWPGGLTDEGSSVYTAFEWPATYHQAPPVTQQQSSFLTLSQPSAGNPGSATAIGGASAKGGWTQSSSIDHLGLGGPSLEGELQVRPRRFLRGKAKYGEGYVAPHVMRRLVSHLRRQGLQKQAAGSAYSAHRAGGAKRRRSGSSFQDAANGMASLDIRGGVEMVAEGDAGDEDDDDEEGGAHRDRRRSGVGSREEESADMANLSDDSEVDGEKGEDAKENKPVEHNDEEEVDALDVLADFSIELLRANAVRNDQILSLLESLVGHAAAFPENTGDGAALGEGHVGAPPTVALPRTTASKASYHRMGAPGAAAAAGDGSGGGDDYSSHHEEAGEDGEDDGGKEVEESGHCDPEAVLVACRLLLAGLGPWLESAASQVDAQAATKTMADDDWFEKELAQAANTSKAAASARSAGWPTSLNSGMPPGLPAGAYASAGVRNPLTRTSAAAATTFPATSLYEADVEPRHSAPLTRLLRRIAFAPTVAPPDPSLPPADNGEHEQEQRQQSGASKASMTSRAKAAEVEPPPNSVFGASSGSPTRSLPPHPVNAVPGGYPGGPGWEADLRWAADDLRQGHGDHKYDGVPEAGQRMGTNDSSNAADGGGVCVAFEQLQPGNLERGDSAAESDESLLQVDDDNKGGDHNQPASDAPPSMDDPWQASGAAAVGAATNPSSHLGAAHYLASASRFLATSRLYRWDPKVARSVDAVEVRAQRAAAERLAQENFEAGLEAIKEGARSFDRGFGGIGGSAPSFSGESAPPDGHLAPHLHSYASGPFRAPPLHTLRSRRDRAIAKKEARAKRRADRRRNAGHTTPAALSDGVVLLQGSYMGPVNEGASEEESPNEDDDYEDDDENAVKEEASEAILAAAAAEEAWARVTAAEAAFTQEAETEREALRAAERAVEKWFDWDKDRPSFDVGAMVVGDEGTISEAVDVGTAAAGAVNLKSNDDTSGNAFGGSQVGTGHTKEGGQGHGVEYSGASDHDGNHAYDQQHHDSWTCPLTGAFMWRSERAAYLGQPVGPHQSAGAAAYRAAWLTSLAALKVALKQAQARRKGLLLHGQAHVPFLGALCALVDCGGDDAKALKRFSGRAGHALMPAMKKDSAQTSKKRTMKQGEEAFLEVKEPHEVPHRGSQRAAAAGSASDAQAATTEEEEEVAWVAVWGEAYPRRDGELYKEEMALGSRVIGHELTAWMNEKRVRKNWADILARNHAHLLPDGLVEHNAQQQEKKQQAASKEVPREHNQDWGADSEYVEPAEDIAIELINWW